MWSLAMIVRDAEATIGQVLDDASAFCDELIVVDTGSVDKTMALAIEKGAKVYEFDWIDDFAAARNFAFLQCSGDWIVWLDADDRVPPKAQEGFAQLKRATELSFYYEPCAFMVDYRAAFDADDNPTFAYARERVLRRKAEPRWVGPVHECIPLLGPAPNWPYAWVEHRPQSEAKSPDRATRNLRILRKAIEGGDDTTRNLFYFANELTDHGIWQEAFDVYSRYIERDGTMVWERHYALLKMATCAEHLGWDDDPILFLIHQAIQLDPRRAEAWVRAGRHYYDRKQWELAVPYFTAAAKSEIEPPTDGFVSLPAYGYLALDFLASCVWELTGDGQRAYALSMKSMELGNPDKERMNRNLGVYWAAAERGTGTPP